MVEAKCCTPMRLHSLYQKHMCGMLLAANIVWRVSELLIAHLKNALIKCSACHHSTFYLLLFFHIYTVSNFLHLLPVKHIAQ